MANKFARLNTLVNKEKNSQINKWSTERSLDVKSRDFYTIQEENQNLKQKAQKADDALRNISVISFNDLQLLEPQTKPTKI